MRSIPRILRIVILLAVPLAIATLLSLASAQTPAAPGPSQTPLPSAPPPPTAGGGEAWPAAAILALGLLGIIGAAAKMIDLRAKREAEAIQVQARISDALLRDRALVGLRIVATARVPVWKGSPATIEVSGQLPTPELREAALRFVEREVSRLRPDVRLEDRLAVVPSLARRAA